MACSSFQISPWFILDIQFRFVYESILHSAKDSHNLNASSKTNKTIFYTVSQKRDPDITIDNVGDPFWDTV